MDVPPVGQAPRRPSPGASVSRKPPDGRAFFHLHVRLAPNNTKLADEQAGPLASVRGLVEHTAHRIARQPGAVGNDTAHRLELIARRLHSIQQDLDSTAAQLVQPRAVPAPAPAAARHTGRRSP